MKSEWTATDKELPPEDGTYLITNDPHWRSSESSLICSTLEVPAHYDGYGFNYLGIYRDAMYWKKYNPPKKKYGPRAPDD